MGRRRRRKEDAIKSCNLQHTLGKNTVGDDKGKEVERIGKKKYNEELFRLQLDLIKLQEWVKSEGLKVVVIFEGRDAAGKGGWGCLALHPMHY